MTSEDPGTPQDSHEVPSKEEESIISASDSNGLLPDAPDQPEEPQEEQAPDAAAPEGPAEEAVAQPVAEARVSEPVVETPEPAAEEHAAEAVAEPTTLDEPDAEEPTPEPVAEEAAPAAEEPTPEPVAEEAAAEPAGPVDVEPELAAAVEEAFEGVDAEAAATPALLDEGPGDWFVVHTYSGYENKVKTNLETRISSMNMENKIYEVVIPTEEVVEVKGGKKQAVQRKVLPGYVLVRMDLDDDSWYVVRNTPNVTGFVGSGSKPIPLSAGEVERILRRKEEAAPQKARAEWQASDPVRVTTGPFANFQGVISEVDIERQKVKVLVNIFGRETPVELGFDQIAKV